MALNGTKGSDRISKGMLKVVWAMTAQGEGSAEELGRADSITVQLEERTGGTITIEASNDGVTFYTLPTALVMAADGIESVAVDSLGFRFYRPALTVADDTLTITMIAAYRGLS